MKTCARCGTTLRSGQTKFCSRTCYWAAKPRFSGHAADEIVRMYVDEGRSCPAIGRIVGAGYEVIQDVLRRRGIAQRSRFSYCRPTKTTASVVEKIVALKKAGTSTRAIEDATGLSNSVVCRMIQRHMPAHGISTHASVHREELAWAAGFFDGEGNVRLTRHDLRTNGRSLTMSVKQVDRRPLDRFQAAVFGIGIIRGPFQLPSPNWRPIHCWTANGPKRTLAVCAALWPFLSPLKREQFAHVLSMWREHIRGVDKSWRESRQRRAKGRRSS